MISKSFKYGSGSFNACIGYLLNDERVNKGESVLIHGDDIDTLKLAVETNPRKQKFQSMVWSFSKEETEMLKKDPEKLMKIIKDIEKYSFRAGNQISRNDIAQSWILHQDKGRYELHCVFAKQFLSTGKKFDPINYGFGKTKYRTAEYVKHRNVNEYIINKYDLEKPNEVKHKIMGKIDKFDNHNPVDLELKKIVNIVNKSKTISNRSDVINFLKKQNIKILKEYPNGLKIDYKGHSRFLKNGPFGKDFNLLKDLKENRGNKNIKMDECLGIVNKINNDEYSKYLKQIEKKKSITIKKVDFNISDKMIQKHINDLKHTNINIPKTPYRGAVIGGGSGDSPSMYMLVWDESAKEYITVTNPAYEEWLKRKMQESKVKIDTFDLNMK